MIHTDYPIGDKFTWRLDVKARYFARVSTVEDLLLVLDSDAFRHAKSHYVLGSGANTLFAHSYYDGFVMQIGLSGIEHLTSRNQSERIVLKVAAGEDWHSLVKHTVYDLHMGGIENLAYIPGTCGAAAIQNIGAYGHSFEDVFVELEALDIHTKKKSVFTKEMAEFGYRTSMFKTSDFRTKYIILSTTILLTPAHIHHTQTQYYSNYESLQGELPAEGPYSIAQVFEAVVRLRQKKLPDVAQVGTNGSLFINPIVSGSHLLRLLSDFPLLQYYPSEKMKYPPKNRLPIEPSQSYKIAAGHIFDVLGWKHKRVGQVGTWSNHALILCNYGTQNPEDIMRVIGMMQDDFESATGIQLIPEINIVTT